MTQPTVDGPDGFPDTVDDDSPEHELTGDPEDVALPTDEGYLGSDAFGTTPAEELEGEPLGDRLAHEVPDVVADEEDGPGGGDRVGQLTSYDGDAQFDTDSGAVAFEEGFGGESAEENAMHLEPEEG